MPRWNDCADGGVLPVEPTPRRRQLHAVRPRDCKRPRDRPARGDAVRRRHRGPPTSRTIVRPPLSGAIRRQASRGSSSRWSATPALKCSFDGAASWRTRQPPAASTFADTAKTPHTLAIVAVDAAGNPPAQPVPAGQLHGRPEAPAPDVPDAAPPAVPPVHKGSSLLRPPACTSPHGRHRRPGGSHVGVRPQRRLLPSDGRPTKRSRPASITRRSRAMQARARAWAACCPRPVRVPTPPAPPTFVDPTPAKHRQRRRGGAHPGRRLARARTSSAPSGTRTASLFELMDIVTMIR